MASEFPPLRVLLRADAGITQGTGHVMRCLTLAEGLRARGHRVELMTGPLSVSWLRDLVADSGVVVHECRSDEIATAEILRLAPDWVVVDSYRFPAADVSELNESVPVLAIVDGDTRQIQASLYLDQNLGAEDCDWPEEAGDRMMAGADYALVRDTVATQRRDEPWQPRAEPPSVLCFMGGTDPTGASIWAAKSLRTSIAEFDLTVVAPSEQHEELAELLRVRGNVRLLTPTPRLPELLGNADIVLSAAGTSAWDICTLAVPAILVAVVANQQASLHAAQARGLVLGVDRAIPEALSDDLPRVLVERLVDDSDVRQRLSRACLDVFDGRGKERVAQRMETQLHTGSAGIRTPWPYQ